MLKKNLLPLITGIIVLGMLTLLVIFFAPSHKGNTIHVALKETGFEPQNVTIEKGDTVIFTTERGKQFWPASDLHPTHGIYPEFDPQEPIEANDTWKFVFDKKGSWKYHDHLDPFYRGIIIVK